MASVSRPRSATARLAGIAAALACTAAVLLSGPSRAADADPLSSDQLQQLLRVDDRMGTHITLPDPVQSTLALGPAQVKDGLKQVMFEDATGVRHGFAPLADRSGYFMVRRETGTRHTVFHVDDKLKLVKAARNFTNGERLIELPGPEAERELKDEFAQWSKVLMPGKAAATPAGPAATAASRASPASPAAQSKPAATPAAAAAKPAATAK